MLAYLLAVVAAVAGLARAADEFVVGSATLARRFGVSPVVVGAVVVGFGTSMPELLISGLAATGDHADLAVGNIVGSNVTNLTLVLGAAAAISPVAVHSAVLRREGLLAVAAVAGFALAIQGSLERWEGVVLLAALGVVLLVIMRTRRDGELTADVEAFVAEEAATSTRLEVLRTGLGLAVTVAAAQLLVWGAVGIAREIGVSDGFIGFSLVAIGSSLPELVTAVQASRRGEPELLVGNLLGSNLFNSLAVGGLVLVVAPGAPVGSALTSIGAGTMVVVALLTVAVMARGGRVTRAEAMGLLATYAVTVLLLA